MAQDLVTRVRQDVEQYRLLERGGRLVVAVSGGPDSTALLQVLADLRAEYGLGLVAAYLDHGLRDTSAERAWVVELARRVGVPLRLARLPRGALRHRPGGLEAAARRARYAFLRRVAEEEGAGRIAVGHTADDQAETVFLRLLRGAGPAGLAAMAPRRADGVIRPLLGVWRREIEVFLAERGLRAVRDPTNQERGFLRNRIRLDVLPALSRLNPGFPRHLVQLATLLRDDEAVLHALAEEAWRGLAVESRPSPGGEPGEEQVCFPLAGLAALPVALQRRVLRRGFTCLAPGGLPYEHVERLRAAARGEVAAASLDLPGDVTARVAGDRLCLERRSPARPAGPVAGTVHGPWPVAVPGRTEVPALGIAVVVERVGPAGAGGPGDTGALARGPELRGEQPPWVGCSIQLSLDRVEGGLWVRRRRPGDRIRPPGLEGRKKLSDLFIDEKVPRSLRERWPVLADAAGVVWVPGLRADARVVGQGVEAIRVTVLSATAGEGEEVGGRSQGMGTAGRVARRGAL